MLRPQPSSSFHSVYSSLQRQAAPLFATLALILSILALSPPASAQEPPTPDVQQLLSPATPDLNWVAILVPLSFFLFLLGLVALFLYFRHAREKKRYETIQMIVERGGDLPLALLEPKGSSDLKRGVLLAASGAGVAFFFIMVDGLSSGAWSMGVIPLLIGLGYLLVWKLEQRRR